MTVQNNSQARETDYCSPTKSRLSFVPGLYIALIDSRPVELSESELLILQTLADRPRHAFERKELLVESLGEDRLVDERIIDTHIKNIRSKFLAASPDTDVIKTVHGYGYRFEGSKLDSLPPLVQPDSFKSHGSTLVLDDDGHRIFVDDLELDLTESEYAVLHFLAKHPNQELENEKISRTCLGIGFLDSGRILATHIKNLRKKLNDTPRDPKWIKTIHSFGYRFEGLRVKKLEAHALINQKA